MNINQIAIFHGPLREKFGIPRQSGLAGSLEGSVELCGEYAREEALRGLEGFDRIWLIWGFSANSHVGWSPTVRPPRLGGNKTVGVFASRSPFRPNPLGLSCVRLERIEGTRLIVRGADLMDGTPIYDIKPYVPYADAFPEAAGGFTDSVGWETLEVVLPENDVLSEDDAQALRQILAQDPRPQYQDDPKREYGMAYGRFNVRFRVEGNILTVTEILPEQHSGKVAD